MRLITFLFIAMFSCNCFAVYNFQNYPWTKGGYELVRYSRMNKDSIMRNATAVYPEYKRYQVLLKPIFEKYQVPPEVLTLSAIESGFKETVKSHAGARGLWQLMPSTARDLGLVVNKSVDERTDVMKSSDAAIRYIKWLAEEKFGGDYETAIIAYNSGIGNTSKSVAKANSSNAWALIEGAYVPKESSLHLMKFLTYLTVFNYLDGQG